MLWKKSIINNQVEAEAFFPFNVRPVHLELLNSKINLNWIETVISYESDMAWKSVQGFPGINFLTSTANHCLYWQQFLGSSSYNKVNHIWFKGHTAKVFIGIKYYTSFIS